MQNGNSTFISGESTATFNAEILKKAINLLLEKSDEPSADIPNHIAQNGCEEFFRKHFMKSEGNCVDGEYFGLPVYKNSTVPKGEVHLRNKWGQVLVRYRIQ